MRYRWLAVAAASLVLALLAGSRMRRLHEPRFPPLAELKAGPYSFQDASLAVAGFRAPAADLAWIQLLQYTAGAVPELPDLTVYIHALTALVAGRRLVGVRLRSPFVLRSVDPPIESVEG